MLDLEVLVLKLGSIDALSSCSVSSGEISSYIPKLTLHSIKMQRRKRKKTKTSITLDHELGNDTVEFGSLVAKGFATLAFALLSGGESSLK